MRLGRPRGGQGVTDGSTRQHGHTQAEGLIELCYHGGDRIILKARIDDHDFVTLRIQMRADGHSASGMVKKTAWGL